MSTITSHEFEPSTERLRFDTEKTIKETLNKLIPVMVRQAHHERNQRFTVRPELVEGLVQSFLNPKPRSVR